jgi:hypothetical protein
VEQIRLDRTPRVGCIVGAFPIIDGRKTAMKPIGATALGFGALSLLTLVSAIAQQPTIQRKVLLTQDLPIPGYQAVMAAVESRPGVARADTRIPGRWLSTSRKGSSRLTKKANQR